MTSYQESLEIDVHWCSGDRALFESIINEGIDARLEGFVKSVAFLQGGRLIAYFDRSELQILIRRLIEKDTDEADQWVCDIVQAEYDVEVRQ